MAYKQKCLSVREAGKSKTKAPADLVAGERLLSRPPFIVIVHGGGKWGALRGYKSTNPVHQASALMT